MSLSFPTVRKQKHHPAAPEREPGRRNDKHRAGKVIAFAVAVALAGGLYLMCIVQPGATRPKVLAAVPNGELAAIHDSGFVVARDAGFVFMDTHGSSFPVSGSYEYVIASGPWIIGMDPPLMYLITPGQAASEFPTVRVAQTERPLPLLGGDVVVTSRPQSSARFGEPWSLRAFSGEGLVLWENVIPHAPFTAVCDGQHLVIAAVDISGGGTPWAMCLSRHTGQRHWQQPLGPGAWRHLAVCPDGSVRAVLDSGAYCLTREGAIAWIYRPDGTVVSAAATSGILAVSVSKRLSGSTSLILGNAQIAVLGADGEILWERKCSDSNPRLFIWEGRLIVLESGGLSCFELETGNRLFSYKVDGYPITSAKNVILIHKDRNLALVDPGISKSVR